MKDEREQRMNVQRQEDMRKRAKAHVASERQRARAKLDAAIHDAANSDAKACIPPFVFTTVKLCMESHKE